MTTMILPATAVEIPSDEWVLRDFRVRPSYSEGGINFKGILAHKPSKQYAEVSNGGRGRKSTFGWYKGDEGDYKNLLAEFVADCGMEQEEVIQLFVEEMIQQQNFSNIVGTVVRTDAGDMISRKSPEELRGQVEGKYWDRKAKNWVPLNG